MNFSCARPRGCALSFPRSNSFGLGNIPLGIEGWRLFKSQNSTRTMTLWAITATKSTIALPAKIEVEGTAPYRLGLATRSCATAVRSCFIPIIDCSPSGLAVHISLCSLDPLPCGNPEPPLIARQLEHHRCSIFAFYRRVIFKRRQKFYALHVLHCCMIQWFGAG